MPQYSAMHAERISREIWIVCVSLYKYYTAKDTDYDTGMYMDFSDMQTIKLLSNRVVVTPYNGGASAMTPGINVSMGLAVVGKKLYLHCACTNAGSYNTNTNQIVAVVYAK